MNKETIITIAVVVFLACMVMFVAIDEIIDAKSALTEIPSSKLEILKDYQSGLEYMHTNIDSMTWEEFKVWEKDRLHREYRIVYYAVKTLEKLKGLGQLSL